jgi:hypothetical protein
MGAEKRLLNGFLGQLLPREPADRHPHQRPLIPPHEVRKSLRLAGLGGGDQHSIGTCGIQRHGGNSGGQSLS